jgi:hypothetical protein
LSPNNIIDAKKLIIKNTKLGLDTSGDTPTTFDFSDFKSNTYKKIINFIQQTKELVTNLPLNFVNGLVNENGQSLAQNILKDIGLGDCTSYEEIKTKIQTLSTIKIQFLGTEVKITFANADGQPTMQINGLNQANQEGDDKWTTITAPQGNNNITYNDNQITIGSTVIDNKYKFYLYLSNRSTPAQKTISNQLIRFILDPKNIENNSKQFLVTETKSSLNTSKGATTFDFSNFKSETYNDIINCIKQAKELVANLPSNFLSGLQNGKYIAQKILKDIGLVD